MKESTNPVIAAHREFTADGFPTEPNRANLEARYADNPSLEKIDRFALLIPVLKDITTLMKKQTPEPTMTVGDFDVLKSQARSALNLATNDHLRENPLEPDDPLVFLAERRVGKEGVRELLKRSSKTSLDSMNSLLFRLPFIYQEKYGAQSGTPEEILAVAKKNYHLILRDAGMHGGDLETQQSIVPPGRNSFDTVFSYLELDENNKAHVSEKIHTAFPHHFDETGEVMKRTYITPELGCPALYSDAIRSLWNWHLIGAERIYMKDMGGLYIPKKQIFPQLELAAD